MKNLIIYLLSGFIIMYSSLLTGQEVVVSLRKMNTLYRGIDNPISIAAEKYPCSRIVVTSSVGKLTKMSSCRYVFNDTSQAKEVYIKVGVKSGDTVKWLSTHVFRQRKLPCPEIKVAEHRSNDLCKADFLRNPMLKLTYREYVFIPDTSLIINSWSVHVLRNDTTLFRLTEIKGSYFPDELIRIIDAAQPGDLFIFYDFVLSNPSPICKYPDSINIRMF